MTDKLELKSSHEVIETVNVADVESIFYCKPTDPDILTVLMTDGKRLYCDEVCPVDSMQEEQIKGEITMATVKSYTDLEQSKKLAEILPLESADYYHALDAGVVIVAPYITYCGEERCVPAYKDAVPCWSLAALLDIITKHIKDYNVLRIDISENDFAIWYDKIDFGVNNDLPDITADNPIDACYEMILKLHELKML